MDKIEKIEKMDKLKKLKKWDKNGQIEKIWTKLKN